MVYNLSFKMGKIFTSFSQGEGDQPEKKPSISAPLPRKGKTPPGRVFVRPRVVKFGSPSRPESEKGHGDRRLPTCVL